MVTMAANILEMAGFKLNCASPEQLEQDLPAGFLAWLEPLHRRFAPFQQRLLEQRAGGLADALEGRQPTHHFPGNAARSGWKIELPQWCQDQRNQMTGQPTRPLWW